MKQALCWIPEEKWRHQTDGHGWEESVSRHWMEQHGKNGLPNVPVTGWTVVKDYGLNWGPRNLQQNLWQLLEHRHSQDFLWGALSFSLKS